MINRFPQINRINNSKTDTIMADRHKILQLCFPILKMASYSFISNSAIYWFLSIYKVSIPIVWEFVLDRSHLLDVIVTLTLLSFLVQKICVKLRSIKHVT